MSKGTKASRKGGPPGAQADRKSFPLATAAGLAVLVAAALGIWWNRSRPADPLPAVASPAERTGTNLPAVVEAKPDFQKLKGQWLRPDGGYVIAIRGVDAAGRMDAAYFNPRPINVAKAQASREGETFKVLIELRDANYPGSTYTLAYHPATDRLVGNYFQAVMRQNFEVEFVRQP